MDYMNRFCGTLCSAEEDEGFLGLSLTDPPDSPDGEREAKKLLETWTVPNEMDRPQSEEDAA
jgi:hypothetical protein